MDGSDNDPKDFEPEPSTASSTKPAEFNASKGWFNKFQRRFNLKCMFLHGEASSADKPADEEYDAFKSIVK